MTIVLVGETWRQVEQAMEVHGLKPSDVRGCVLERPSDVDALRGYGRGTIIIVLRGAAYPRELEFLLYDRERSGCLIARWIGL